MERVREREIFEIQRRKNVKKRLESKREDEKVELCMYVDCDPRRYLDLCSGEL